ncbi:response regulator [Nitrosopumilus sp. b1]|uniref:response regulator n=1 Tax=Nitrosopumilus sp. b1 TaxID=2109907 RepID=UPI000E2B05F0|nr:response regulator [Nitrosopumilus sp. b1]RDJ31805.1 MAG: response regulator [Thermoproteota archaeon]KAF6242110.1 response regulator [Nitrosopumilus sp. b1]RDJ34629.1 MAG: response regulator [Thermoproteota archaeon]RDJ34704.1 MAG: response regulator [Thermoproteota archaeon]RDJ38427.1 MAG: response regulator [Thermoproteota archaeon]
MSKDKTILLADDDSDFLEATQLMLMDEGYNVIPAVDGEDAVEKYRQIKPDIVFLDIKMPGIDGFETFFRIIKSDSDARVVFTSSYAINDDKFKKAKSMSLRDLINKPIEFEQLEKMIKKHAK